MHFNSTIVIWCSEANMILSIMINRVDLFTLDNGAVLRSFPNRGLVEKNQYSYFIFNHSWNDLEGYGCRNDLENSVADLLFERISS